MTNDQVNQIIQGVGLMTELWSITFMNFKNQGMSDAEAITHTKALISIMMGSIMGMGDGEATK